MNKTKIINKQNIIYALILYFPLIYIWFAIISKDNYMRIFYFVYSAIIIILRISNFKTKRIKTKDIIVLSLLSLYTMINIFMFNDTESRSSGLLFAIMYFYMFIYGDENFRSDYLKYFVKNEKKYFIMIILYYFAMFVTIITGIGISYRWGTISLQGPYGLAHIFAYELLLLSLNSYLLYAETKRKKWIIILIINICLMILTNVRTTLLCSIFIISYYFFKKKNNKKFIVLFMGILLVFVLYYYTPLFHTILEKTNNASQTGDITNARFAIWSNSFNMFKESDLFHKLFGNGMQSLMDYNLRNIRMSIHAHNELIDILAAYGIVSFIEFSYCFKRIIKGKNSLGFIISFLILAWFNGVYSDCSFVIGLITMRILFDRINTIEQIE